MFFEDQIYWKITAKLHWFKLINASKFLLEKQEAAHSVGIRNASRNYQLIAVPLAATI